ncbi:MAG TPA: HAMP domain-containing sensor histidine kinase [Gemmatirosa sp.]
MPGPTRDPPYDPAHGVPRSSGALWIPFATVIVLLAALAVVPLAMSARSLDVRRQLSEHVGPARVAVNDLEAGIGVELYEAATGARVLGPTASERGRVAHATVAADIQAVDSLVAPLNDPRVRASAAELHAGVAAWHTAHADARGLAALDAAERLDNALSSYTDRQARAITRARETELASDAVLVGLAALGVVMLARAGLRTARLAALAASQHRALVAAHAEREAVLRGVTHDLRNPLAAARGHVELVAEEMLGPVNARQADSLARSFRLITATLDGVDDLLAVAMADGAGLAVRPHRVSLAALARDAVAEHAAVAARAGLTLTCSVDTPDAAALWIETDPTRVHQVLGNLLSNACKYTPSGGCVEVAGAADASGGVWLAVRDSGPGVPPEAYERVFGELVRLPGTRHIAGAGVGLAAARRVARALGGDLTAGAAPQGGAAFTLTLPARGA